MNEVFSVIAVSAVVLIVIAIATLVIIRKKARQSSSSETEQFLDKEIKIGDNVALSTKTASVQPICQNTNQVKYISITLYLQACKGKQVPQIQFGSLSRLQYNSFKGVTRIRLGRRALLSGVLPHACSSNGMVGNISKFSIEHYMLHM